MATTLGNEMIEVPGLHLHNEVVGVTTSLQITLDHFGSLWVTSRRHTERCSYRCSTPRKCVLYPSSNRSGPIMIIVITITLQMLSCPRMFDLVLCIFNGVFPEIVSVFTIHMRPQWKCYKYVWMVEKEDGTDRSAFQVVSESENIR